MINIVSIQLNSGTRHKLLSDCVSVAKTAPSRTVDAETLRLAARARNALFDQWTEQRLASSNR